MNAFVCSTPIQIVRAAYMKYAMPEFADSADLFISPTFGSASLVIENLRGTGLFENVWSINTNRLHRAPSVRLIYGNSKLARQIKNSSYKKIIAFNIESAFLNALYNRNKHSEGFQYHYVEDAPGIYKMYAPLKFSAFSLNGIMRIEQPYYNTFQWWFSNPDFMNTPGVEAADIRKLPPVDIYDDEFVDFINKVFQFSPDEALNKADVLITEESFYTDGKMIDNYDYALFEEIRENFPEKKFIVKLHPRTKINRFEKGFQLMGGTGIPLEIYVMNGLRQKQQFPIQIGIACSALTSDKFMFDVESPKIVLAPLFQDKLRKLSDGSSNVDSEVLERFEALKKTYAKPEQMVITYRKEVLFDTLNKWLNL